MKVIAFNGSPHIDGVIAKGILLMQRELEKAAISVEVIHVGSKNIRGCIDCRQCRNGTDHCIFQDGGVNEAIDKLRTADGIILGSPAYYGGIAGTFKCFLDRLFFAGPNMPFKVGATVVSVRRTGGITAFQQLNNYFNISGIMAVPTIYWNVMHGNSVQETLEDQEGQQIMEMQGRNMAWLIKTLAAAKEDVPLPPPITDRKKTNFIH
jgi:multimeric flavodoxin WrbA